jgi:hypothetical protein
VLPKRGLGAIGAGVRPRVPVVDVEVELVDVEELDVAYVDGIKL